jgi:hypothetical protein
LKQGKCSKIVNKDIRSKKWEKEKNDKRKKMKLRERIKERKEDRQHKEKNGLKDQEIHLVRV